MVWRLVLTKIFLAPGRFLAAVLDDYRAKMAQRRSREAAGHCRYCGSHDAEGGECYDCWYVRR